MNIKADFISWTVLVGIILLLLEISFNDGGPFFLLLINIGCIYYGRKNFKSTFGKVLFWFGLISFIITILNTMAFKFWLMAILVYVIVRYAQSKEIPHLIKPEVQLDEGVKRDEIIRSQPLFQNKWIGSQETTEHVYEWNDINVQGGIGDTVVDLSYTVLPKGEAVIFLRHFIGNVKIFIPYEVEVSLQHSVIAGATNIFGVEEKTNFNKVFRYKTASYQEATSKVKIMTSLGIGDIEVKRI
ncbi:cell wall-active antibiotics response protein LiaF [Bacillus sp. 2205SS5-2]|uniref:cell wall-active antibiotics response protein LiaF n=1 Tax=Bacillus sp. 2205SS5-2 TaxID=3109031 RepID=UPI0030073EC8